MSVFFTNWLFQQLPKQIQVTDSYKNSAGQGLLQRYLSVFGQSLDEDFVPFIDNFTDIIDYETCDDKFLPLLSGIIGYPPNIDGTDATYRKVLGYAIAIYKIKGTIESFNILFNLLGLEILIQAEVPPQSIFYDQPNSIYDAEVPEDYDQECAYCSGYTIAYNSEEDTTIPWVYNTVPPSSLQSAQNIINWLNPINAQFSGFIRRIKIRDGFTLNATDSYTLTLS